VHTQRSQDEPLVPVDDLYIGLRVSIAAYSVLLRGRVEHIAKKRPKPTETFSQQKQNGLAETSNDNRGDNCKYARTCKVWCDVAFGKLLEKVMF